MITHSPTSSYLTVFPTICTCTFSVEKKLPLQCFQLSEYLTVNTKNKLFGEILPACILSYLLVKSKRKRKSSSAFTINCTCTCQPPSIHFHNRILCWGITPQAVWIWENGQKKIIYNQTDEKVKSKRLKYLKLVRLLLCLVSVNALIEQNVAMVCIIVKVLCW
jgi:hypothetical protein